MNIVAILSIICKGEAEEFIESLEEYEDNDWDALKKKLEESYKKKDIIPANNYHHFTVNPERFPIWHPLTNISDDLWLLHEHSNKRK
jgi:hypothetical protein